MSLKIKLFLIILFTLLAYAALGFFVQRFLIIPSYIALERAEAQRDIERCVEALYREIVHLDMTCHDWSAWDDTYLYVQGKDDEYESSNLVDTIFTDTVNLIYLFDKDGNKVWGNCYDLELKEKFELKEFSTNNLTKKDPLLQHGDVDSNITGLFISKKCPVLISSRPIITSGTKGPIMGTMIIGQFINSDLLNKLREQTRVEFHAWPIKDTQIPPSDRSALNQITSRKPFFFSTQSKSLLQIYTTFPDVDDAPALLMRADIPRNISAKGTETMRFAIALTVFVGSVVLVVFILLLQRIIVNPISGLTKHAISIRESKDLSKRLSMGRNDEIGMLATEFDNMVNQLQNDITARRQAEDSLHDTEAKYRSMMETMEECVYICSPDFRVVYMNPSMIKRVGPDAAEKPCYKAINGFDDKCPWCNYAIVQKGEKYSVEITSPLDNRSYIVSSAPIFYADGLILKMTIYTDITSRKQAEAELQKHRDRLEQLVHERTSELFLSNEELRREIEVRKGVEETVRLNESRLAVLLKLSEMRERTFKELAGFVTEEGIRMTQSRIGFLGLLNAEETIMKPHTWSKSVQAQCRISDLPIEYPLERAGLWAEAVRQRKPIIVNDYSDPSPHVKGFPEGHIKLIRLLVFPLVDRGRVVAVLAAANKIKAYDDMDIAQLKLLMEGMWEITKLQNSNTESRRLREELSHLTRVATVGELTTTLAHELNQPLAAILSNVQAVQRMLESDVPDMAEVKDALADVVDDNRRASGVIRSLRKFLQKGGVHKKPVDVNTIILETLSLATRDLVVNDIALTLELGDDLPPVPADGIQLQQVMLNLILNAVEAMMDVAKGARKLVVRTSCDDPAVVTVVFQDSGAGIDCGKADNLFDPFFSTKAEGLGMGLSISRTIIEAHAGRIWAAQNPDGGAAFSFTLPVDKE